MRVDTDKYHVCTTVTLRVWVSRLVQSVEQLDLSQEAKWAGDTLQRATSPAVWVSLTIIHRLLFSVTGRVKGRRDERESESSVLGSTVDDGDRPTMSSTVPLLRLASPSTHLHLQSMSPPSEGSGWARRRFRQGPRPPHHARSVRQMQGTTRTLAQWERSHRGNCRVCPGANIFGYCLRLTVARNTQPREKETRKEKKSRREGGGGGARHRSVNPPRPTVYPRLESSCESQNHAKSSNLKRIPTAV